MLYSILRLQRSCPLRVSSKIHLICPTERRRSAKVHKDQREAVFV